MNIAILSQKPSLYSTKSLINAAIKRGHIVKIVNPLRCKIIVEKNNPQIYYRLTPLKDIDAIVPRIGASITFYGAAVIKQLEVMGAISTTSSQALLQSRDKLRSLQLLSMSGLGMPKTAFTNYTKNIKQLIESVGGVPIVVKLLEGTQGLGVVLIENLSAAESVIEAFHKIRARIIVQEFIAEAMGSDIRAFVVNGKVVGAMRRMAKKGEFRSNLHRGASAVSIKLNEYEEMAAIKAAEIMGLKVAGVDMLNSNRGPLILEVNASPGLEGIEKATGIDIAGKIMEYLEKEYREKKKQ